MSTRSKVVETVAMIGKDSVLFIEPYFSQKKAKILINAMPDSN